MPEPWFHTELFGAFSAIAPVSGWVPFDFEVPYKTLYPVRPPQGTEWKQTGVEKWADLCLHSADGNAWRWFELKVRHVRREPDTQEFAHSAQLAFCKDVVALIGLEIESTVSYWKDYNEHTKAYRDKLTEGAKTLGTGTHHCVVAFVQLGLDQSPSHLNSMFTDKQSLLEVVDKLLNDGAKASGHPRACPDFSLKPLIMAGIQSSSANGFTTYRYATVQVPIAPGFAYSEAGRFAIHPLLLVLIRRRIKRSFVCKH